jgi:hypothetical protein
MTQEAMIRRPSMRPGQEKASETLAKKKKIESQA